ncbi:cell division protein ZipA [Oceanimonas sp. CHS3-5]|uniref:cell division protein ZipA n=1 Tax=Oceanimonas sp. CHS3-5 TaxID=3068186 RepID=UPI00274002E8|nr:cell division protein ZipA [Oceanimonas sp. CHS3-5]MDP5290693.1 cell division protein ZipA [Oceanimonas sp. CHS3-5]
MQDLRIILIILGAMAIAALLIHGLWTSKKDRQPAMRNKPMGKVASEPATSDDFDQDGIGQVRVVSGPRAGEPVAGEPVRREEPHFSALDEDDETQAAGPELKPQPAKPAPAAEVKANEQDDEFDPLFDEPVRPAARATVAEPEPAAEPAQPEPKGQPEPASEPEIKAEAPAVAEPAPQPEPEPQAPLREVPRTWQDVYVVNLMARPNQQIDGAALMRALTNNGFHFGDMDIFHHHQTPAGQGSVLFSLINMVKPGTFNPEAMSDFTTPGVSIFMQLPRPGMAKNQFNLMVQTAENLAEELDALLFDVERSPVSPDYLAHCREQLRDYDSQAQ